MRFHKLFLVFLALLAFVSGILESTKIKVQSSNRNRNQVTFVNLKKLSLDFNKISLKKVRKISLHQGRLYILEEQRGEIFVLDIEGHYIYSIGGSWQE